MSFIRQLFNRESKSLLEWGLGRKAMTQLSRGYGTQFPVFSCLVLSSSYVVWTISLLAFLCYLVTGGFKRWSERTLKGNVWKEDIWKRLTLVCLGMEAFTCTLSEEIEDMKVREKENTVQLTGVAKNWKKLGLSWALQFLWGGSGDVDFPSCTTCLCAFYNTNVPVACDNHSFHLD